MCLHGSIVQLLELRDLDGRLLASGLVQAYGLCGAKASMCCEGWSVCPVLSLGKGGLWTVANWGSLVFYSVSRAMEKLKAMVLVERCWAHAINRVYFVGGFFSS